MPSNPKNPLVKIRKSLAGCEFLTANFSNVPNEPLDGSTAHLTLYRHHLPLVPSLAPSVAKVLDDVCERLGVPRDMVHGFLDPSREVNAYCRHDIKSAAVLIVNAGMIANFDEAELRQALGHELGHFLLPVSHERMKDDRPSSWEDARYSRHAELAMDRIGLLAGGDLDAAFRMFIKLQSGLDVTHVRPDAAAYFAATEVGYTVPTSELDACADHPDISLRVRALALFADSDYYLDFIGKKGGKPIAEVNKAIADELAQTVDHYVIASISETLSAIATYLCALAVVTESKVPLADLTSHGFAHDMGEAKNLAERLVGLPASDWESVYKSELSSHIQAAVIRCPRQLAGHLDGVAGRVRGTDMEQKVQDLSEAFYAFVQVLRG